jgi:glucose/arabinose dehydrogenase
MARSFSTLGFGVPLTAVSTLAAACVLSVAAPAFADISPPFTSKITLNTSYVTGASQATDIAFSADGRAIITRKTGQVHVRRADGSVNVVPYPFGGTLDTASEKGLLGVVADPNVAQNQRFYFYVSNGPTSDKHRVYAAVLTAADSLSVDPTPIIGASRGLGPGLEGPANHDGGGMSIHDGKLYVAVGDTGANASPPVNKYSSCLNKGNGKLLRVTLDGTIPSDNPLVSTASVTGCDSVTGPWTTAAPDRRIWAWGFRNPWRFWVDPQTGLSWTGDVGETSQEEISIGGGNQHYGYPFVEGTRVWGDVSGRNCSSLVPGRPCTAPAYSYPRSVGTSITGGLIPDGCGWTDVFGSTHYVFGDFNAGWLRALPVNATRSGLSSTTPVEFATFAGASPVSFRSGPDGALYVVMFGAGAVYRLAPTSCTGPSCAAGAPASTTGHTWALTALLGVSGVLLHWARSRRKARFSA